MKKIYALLSLQLILSGYCFSQPTVQLVAYATGFNRDISGIEHTTDGRLFVTEQLGYIRIVQPGGAVNERPFLDIHSKVTPTHIDSIKEQGLLGLAFSPNYATDGTFYINYTNKDGLGNSVIARYHVSNNPDSADIASEQILLTVYKPYVNHNGGCLKFGPDGYLYCSFGDGGKGADPGNRAQNKDTLLGKILRIDVSGNGAYAIPSTNPFATGGGAPEIWAYGFRNPWRFSFDRLTQNMWIGDVGEQFVEEIDFQPVSSTGGENYSWRCYEGNEEFMTAGCPNVSTLIAPVYTYKHSDANGCSVTGGYVYRGRSNPDMYGYYFFSDYCNGIMSSLSTDGNFTYGQAGDFGGKNFSTFGEDSSGELYVGDHVSGTIYRVVSGPLAVGSVNTDIPYSTIYPQPNNGSFTCEFTLANNAPIEIQVSDATGHIVCQYKQQFGTGRHIVPLQLQNTASGMYVLQLKTSSGSTRHKFLITG